MLGLKRRAKTVESLATILAAAEGTR
jgi:hypothetical protein